MFLKLLKYKFNAQRNLFLVLSAVALCMSAVGAVDLWFLQEHVNNIESSVLSGFAAFFGTALVMVIMYSFAAYTIAMSILLMVQFYKSHFSDEGYLTFTLPVTTHQHLLSSFLNILIWTVITMLVMLICGMIFISPVYTIKDFSIDWIYLDPELSVMGFITPYMILMMIGSLVSSCLIPMLAISIGCVAVKKLKLLASFGIYYGINATVSVITGILSFLSVYGDIYIMSSTDSDTFHLLLTALVPTIIYIGVSVGGYFLMHRIVDKKLNLP